MSHFTIILLRITLIVFLVLIFYTLPKKLAAKQGAKKGSKTSSARGPHSSIGHEKNIHLMITAMEETWGGGPQLRLIVSYFNEDTRSPGEGIDELREDPFWKEKLDEGGIVEEVMTGSYSVYPQDEDESYLVVFDNYAFYWIENESVAFPVPSDATFDGVNWKLLREGRVASSSESEALEKIPDILGIHLELHEFQNSAYFDDEGKLAIGRRTRHYAIVTYQNILNVITANPPTVLPFKGKVSDYSGHIPTPEQMR